MKVYYEVVHDLKDFPKEDIMMIHMNEYSSIYKYYILSSYKRRVCTFVYPIVHVLFASIVIYIYTVYTYARRFKLQQTCKICSECRISNEYICIKIVYYIKGIRTRGDSNSNNLWL